MIYDQVTILLAYILKISFCWWATWKRNWCCTFCLVIGCINTDQLPHRAIIHTTVLSFYLLYVELWLLLQLPKTDLKLFLCDVLQIICGWMPSNFLIRKKEFLSGVLGQCTSFASFISTYFCYKFCHFIYLAYLRSHDTNCVGCSMKK